VEYKSLFLGILFSIGVFALKNGVGLFYFLDSSRSCLKNFGFLVVFSGVYLAIFYLVFLLLGAIDILKYFNLAQTFFKSGKRMHLAMADLFMGWDLIRIASSLLCPVLFIPVLMELITKEGENQRRQGVPHEGSGAGAAPGYCLSLAGWYHGVCTGRIRRKKDAIR